MGLQGWGIGWAWEGWGATRDVGEQGRVGEATGKDGQFLGDGWRVTRIGLAVTETMEGDGAGVFSGLLPSLASCQLLHHLGRICCW